MPMGIVSTDDFDDELRSLNVITPISVPDDEPPINETEVVIEPIVTRGRTKGESNVPDSLRQIIGEESVINGRASALELAKKFDISPSSVSAYNHGATSTKSYHSPTESLTNHINKSKNRLSKKARNIALRAINNISEDKLIDAKATELAIVAKSMSGIMKDMEPSTNSIGTAIGTQFVFYAPQFRDEASYDIIDAKE